MAEEWHKPGTCAARQPGELRSQRALGLDKSSFQATISALESLERNPTTKGELVLKLTVSTAGRAVDATAKGVSNELADCATGCMAGWRFPIPKNKEAEPVTAAFQIKLGLVPD